MFGGHIAIGDGLGRADHTTALAHREPVENPVGVANRGGEADALNVATCEPVETGEKKQQVRAAIIAGEGV